MDFVITAGQANDCTQAIPLLGERKTGHVLADNTDTIVEHIATMGAVAVIPRSATEAAARIRQDFTNKEIASNAASQSSTLPPLRHQIREKQGKLPSSRRSRLLLATPSDIYQYALGGSIGDEKCVHRDGKGRHSVTSGKGDSTSTRTYPAAR